MSIRLPTLRRHRWLATLAVVAFALRALIPAGFMPGGSGPLSLQVCPDGFPAELLAASDHSAHAGHHHHPGMDMPQAGDSATADPSPPPAHQHDHRSWSSGHCVFSAVAGAPPLANSPILAAAAQADAPAIFAATPRLSLDIRFRIAQPRAPPRLA